MDWKETLKDIPISDVQEKLSLGLKPRSGSRDRLEGPCPICKGKTRFNVFQKGNFFLCFDSEEKGHKAGDNIALVAISLNERAYDGERDFKDAATWLAEAFGHQNLIPEITRARPLTEKERDYLARAPLFEQIFERGHQLLFESEGAEALRYLTDVRGYDLDALKNTEWFYLPPADEIKEYLIKENSDIERTTISLKLYGGRGPDFSRLALPFRDLRGNITGFVLRATSKDAKQRWDSTPGLVKECLFNHCHYRREKRLIIVEGYPDAMYLRAIGIDNVVALGMGKLSRDHIRLMLHDDVSAVTLALDYDPKFDKKGDKLVMEGVKNTEHALDLLRDTDITAYVLDPFTLVGREPDDLDAAREDAEKKFKVDPDSYVIKNGPDAFLDLCEKAVSGPRWLFSRTTKAHDLDTEPGMRQALSEGIDILRGTGDPLDRSLLRGEIRESLDLIDEVIDAEIEKQERREAERASRKELKDYHREIGKLLQQEERGEVDLPSIHDRITTLIPASPIDTDSKNYGDLLSQQWEDALKLGHNDLLGYSLTNLNQFALDCDGIQADALYLIAAAQDSGKTSFLISLAIDLLENKENQERYPHLTVLFFSLDDSLRVINNRFIAHKTGLPFNSVQKLKDAGDSHIRRCKEAHNWLADCWKKERLLLHQSASTGHIRSELTRHCCKKNRDVVLIIDDIANVNVGTFKDFRAEHVVRAKELKQLAEGFGIPVIGTAHVTKAAAREGKPSIYDIMETGQYAYECNLGMTLRRGDKESETIKYNIEKNQLSGIYEERKITFVKSCGRMICKTSDTPKQEEERATPGPWPHKYLDC